MIGKATTATLWGLEACLVTVEADVSDGLPMVAMIGYLASEVKEAQDRVRTALRNSGISIPARRITISLSPADLRKEGAGLDLPIAAALLCAFGVCPREGTDHVLLIGELGLNGEVRPVRGVLPMVLRAGEWGCRTCIVPLGNLREAAIVPGQRVLGVESLSQLAGYLRGEQGLQEGVREEEADMDREEIPDFKDLKGQVMLRRAAEVAAAGMHNLLMIGPPGSGKTMAAKCIPSILPEMTREEALEVTKIQSVTGQLKQGSGLARVRPFRAPHHTVTPQALSGGGKRIRPGEVSLAHRGVLFLDELPEFRKEALEILRQPLEDGVIRVSRVGASIEYPSQLMLVAAMNPCACGFFPDRTRCACAPADVRRYLGRISQPLLERFDLCVQAPEVAYQELTDQEEAEDSAAIRARVEQAAALQQARYEGTGFTHNADLNAQGVARFCVLSGQEERLMHAAFEKLHLSARSYTRILKVARTIADLEGAEAICTRHLSEAISYRGIDAKIWGRM